MDTATRWNTTREAQAVMDYAVNVADTEITSTIKVSRLFELIDEYGNTTRHLPYTREQRMAVARKIQKVVTG